MAGNAAYNSFFSTLVIVISLQNVKEIKKVIKKLLFIVFVTLFVTPGSVYSISVSVTGI